MRKLLAVLLNYLVVMNSMADEQAVCRVLDPELVGSYQGECRNGLAEGYGEAQGIARYWGEFHAGRKNGKGVKIWPSGERYEGDLVDDRKQGFGIYSSPDGEVYKGRWRNDQAVDVITPRMLEFARVHARIEAEAIAAVGSPGVVVCRQLTLGISEHEWIRGVVVATSGNLVKITINDSGDFPLMLNGTEITKGASIWDTASSWAACIE